MEAQFTMGSTDGIPYELSVKKRNQYLLETGYFADVTFVVGENNVSIKAHSLILKAASAYFLKMLQTHPQGIICKPEVSPKIFFEMLKYIYTDACDIDPETALAVWRLAEQFQLPDLQRCCLQYAAMRADFVVMDRAFLEVCKPALEAFLATDRLLIYEYDLLLACLKWAAALTLSLQLAENGKPLPKNDTPLFWQTWALEHGVNFLIRPCVTYDPFCDIHGIRKGNQQTLMCSCTFTDIEDFRLEPITASQVVSLADVISGVDVQELRKTLGTILYKIRFNLLTQSQWEQVRMSNILTEVETKVVQISRDNMLFDQPKTAKLQMVSREPRIAFSFSPYEFYPIRKNDPQEHGCDFTNFGVQCDQIFCLEGFTIWSDCIERLYYKVPDRVTNLKTRWHRKLFKTTRQGRGSIVNVVFDKPIAEQKEIHFSVYFKSSHEAFRVPYRPVPAFYSHCVYFTHRPAQQDQVVDERTIIVGTHARCPVRTLLCG